ncbi:MAG: tRNA (adenosine(37)-N6)-threonylcarbamoyltransferase complex ATPase subunit type 1 TsaE [Bacteroidia bacterium]|nr:tRNA (adenosine(37)-N6)-threonylcarbamoyltransferase complex ATPase subunit type 1 TsaE [Bacteroidia bacterium]
MKNSKELTLVRKSFVSRNQSDLIGPALYLIEKSRLHEKVIAIHGEMGAGKTTFIKTICRELGADDFLSSPTFAIMNEYRLGNGQPAYHFDFYRINKESEAYDIGYEQFFYSGNYCFIEWPEKISALLPEHCMKVKIEVTDNHRTLTIEHYE